LSATLRKPFSRGGSVADSTTVNPPWQQRCVRVHT